MNNYHASASSLAVKLLNSRPEKPFVAAWHSAQLSKIPV
jgi:hypothetical protein